MLETKSSMSIIAPRIKPKLTRKLPQFNHLKKIGINRVIANNLIKLSTKNNILKTPFPLLNNVNESCVKNFNMLNTMIPIRTSNLYKKLT